jgi:hypothetical protein
MSGSGALKSALAVKDNSPVKNTKNTPDVSNAVKKALAQAEQNAKNAAANAAEFERQQQALREEMAMAGAAGGLSQGSGVGDSQGSGVGYTPMEEEGGGRRTRKHSTHSKHRKHRKASKKNRKHRKTTKTSYRRHM